MLAHGGKCVGSAVHEDGGDVLGFEYAASKIYTAESVVNIQALWSSAMQFKAMPLTIGKGESTGNRKGFIELLAILDGQRSITMHLVFIFATSFLL